MPNLPPPALPPKAIGKEAKEDKQRKVTRKEKKAARQRLMVNAGLAFVFGITSVAFFASNPFSGFTDNNKPAAAASTNKDPEATELAAAQKEADETPNAGNEFNLGEVFYKQEKWTEAGDAYRKAMQMDPHNVMAMSHLGTVLMNEGKTQDAIPILEQARDTEKRDLATPSQPVATDSDDPSEQPDESSVRDINIPEQLYQAYATTGQHDKAAAELADAKAIDVLHTLSFLLEHSEELYVEKQQKDLSNQYLKDAAEASAHIAPKLKDDIYGRLAIMSVYGSSMDKAHPEKEVAVKEWLKLMSASLQQTDPIYGKKLADLLKSLSEPPKPLPGTSGAPAAPATDTVVLPAGLSSVQPGKPVILQSSVIDIPAESPSESSTP